MRKLFVTILMLSTLAVFPACGGGGGGGGGVPTQAIVKLISSGTGTLYGIDVSVALAEGVTVKSTSPPIVDTGVVTPSGAAATGTIATAVYTAASGSTPAKVRILIASAHGFGTGEFCSVSGDLAPGSAPKSGDFSIESFGASDVDGNVISGITPTITVTLQ